MITLTAEELRTFVEKEGNWEARSGVFVRVRVTDARQVYGRLDFRIKPTAGTGATWVDSQVVKLDNQTKGGASTKK